MQEDMQEDMQKDIEEVEVEVIPSGEGCESRTNKQGCTLGYKYGYASHKQEQCMIAARAKEDSTPPDGSLTIKGSASKEVRQPIGLVCIDCYEPLCGDGSLEIRHCPNIDFDGDYWYSEPTDSPLYCGFHEDNTTEKE